MAVPLRAVDAPPPAAPALMDASAAATAEPSDAQLVERALATGLPEWFEAIARRHYRAVYAVALAITANVADAEDACHDALVRGLGRLAECRNPDRVGEWLTAIVRNHAKNAVTRSPSRRAVEIAPTIPSPERGATADLSLAEVRAALLDALDTLPDVQREVVLLHDLHDWPHARIAELIGTSAGMCRQHLFKARRTLRERIDPALLEELRDD